MVHKHQRSNIHAGKLEETNYTPSVSSYVRCLEMFTQHSQRQIAETWSNCSTRCSNVSAAFEGSCFCFLGTVTVVTGARLWSFCGDRWVYAVLETRCRQVCPHPGVCLSVMPWAKNGGTVFLCVKPSGPNAVSAHHLKLLLLVRRCF